MDFVREKTYQGQVIKMQFLYNGELSIVTKNLETGKYTLWQKGKKISENSDATELQKKIKGYYDK